MKKMISTLIVAGGLVLLGASENTSKAQFWGGGFYGGGCGPNVGFYYNHGGGFYGNYYGGGFYGGGFRGGFHRRPFGRRHFGRRFNSFCW